MRFLVGHSVRGGFVTFDHGGGREGTVLVVPKDWPWPDFPKEGSRPKGSSDNVGFCSEDQILVLRQNSMVRIPGAADGNLTPSGGVGDFGRRLRAFLADLHGCLEQDGALTRGYRKAGARESVAMVDQVVQVRSGRPSKWAVDIGKVQPIPGGSLKPYARALIELSRIAERKAPNGVGRSFEGMSGTSKRSVVAEAIATHFLEELKEHLWDLRSGYIPRELQLTRIRGRVDPRSIALSTVSGRPEVLCRFREFERGTPLFRMLAGAVEEATAILRFGKGPLHGESAKLVGTCRSAMRSVGEPDTEEAVRIAQAFTLLADERRWAALAELARSILLRRQSRPAEGTLRLQLSFEIAHAFEQWVVECCRVARVATGHGSWEAPWAQYPYDPPWPLKWSKTRKADIVLRERNGGSPRPPCSVVIDCKHKLLGPKEVGASTKANAPEGEEEEECEGRQMVYTRVPVADQYQLQSYIVAEEREMKRTVHGLLVYLLPPHLRRDGPAVGAAVPGSNVDPDEALDELAQEPKIRVRPGVPSVWFQRERDAPGLSIVRLSTPSPEVLAGSPSGRLQQQKRDGERVWAAVDALTRASSQ